MDYKVTNFSPFTSSVLFVGHWQTVQTQTRRRLIRVSAVCIQKVLLKFELK